MFNVLDLELAATAVIVHLADFDEEWVLATARWLQSSFRTEVSKGRLQVIHAPRNLYALKQADLNALDLSGFTEESINGKYLRKVELVGGHFTYWSENGKWILFWRSLTQTSVAHRRWTVGKAEDWNLIQSGASESVVRAPEDMEVLDPIIKGWEEFRGGRWELVPKAGISNLDLSEGELLKFGDSPKRQWWRTKQNLDYTFLMWYAANLSDYYMQLEDDIQPGLSGIKRTVLPNFDAGQNQRLVFDEPVSGEIKVVIKQSRKRHEHDFIKEGSLKASTFANCQEPQRLKELTQAEETWQGTLRGSRCLEISMDKPQKEWVAIREIHVDRVESQKEKQSEKTLPSSAGFLQPRKYGESAASSAVQHALEAALLGFLSGSVAWLVVWQIHKCGERQVGSLGCLCPWSLTFMLLMDLALLSLLESSPSSTPQQQTTSQGPLCKNRKRRTKLPIDWRWLRPGISFVDKTLVRHLGPANDPRHGKWEKRLISVGMIVQPEMDPTILAQAILHLAKTGAGKAIVAVLVGQRKVSLERRQQFLEKLRESLGHVQGDVLHLLDPAADLYPEPPSRMDNIDLALLTAFLEPLSNTFMLIEPNSVLLQDYPDQVERFITHLDSSNIPWIVIEFSKLFGVARKLVRSRLLPRLRELLVMFPNAPADALFWDFIDIVGNQTAPKSIYLSTDATKRDRPDEFFKKNPLVDSLFDNPPGSIRTNMLEIRQDILQSVYDGSKTSSTQVTCGGHTAKSCSECPQGHGASWCNRDCGWALLTLLPSTLQGLWFEIVFDDLQDVEIVSLRMGGTVKPPACDKDCKDKHTAEESPDDEFAHALDDAELFPPWKVKCIRISIPRAQQHPLILRSFDLRSSKASYNNIAGLAAAGVNIPPELDTRWSLQGADQWQEQHLEWVLLMSLALVSGAFAGAAVEESDSQLPFFAVGLLVALAGVGSLALGGESQEQVDDKKVVTEYFNNAGFERWQKIYGEADDVNPVQKDIRIGHAETVDKILKWLDPTTISGKSVCDAGCGTGNLSIPLASRGADVHGSDISSAMVGEAEVRAKETLPSEKIPKFSTSDLEAISGKFDTVCCVDVLIHYPPDKMSGMVQHLAGLSKERLILSFAPKTWCPSNFPNHQMEPAGAT
eukprot:symbB.v1.2.006148.t2/scaffold360.1/size220131/2